MAKNNRNDITKVTVFTIGNNNGYNNLKNNNNLIKIH